jgi:hypothetical protein
MRTLSISGGSLNVPDESVTIPSVTGGAAPTAPGFMVRDGQTTIILLANANAYVAVPANMEVGDVIEGHGPAGWQGVLPAGQTFLNGVAYTGGTIRKVSSTSWSAS